MAQFPYGVNPASGAGRVVGNPFAIPVRHPQGGHGSAATAAQSSRQTAQTAARGRSRDRDRDARTQSPRIVRTPPPGVEEEVHREDTEGRIAALENLAVTHATFLQQIHNDVRDAKHTQNQMLEKI